MRELLDSPWQPLNIPSAFTHWLVPPVSALARSGGPRKMSQSPEEEGTGVASDVVKVEGEDPATPGPLC